MLAAGAWSPSFAAQLGLDLQIRPMRLQIVQTEPMPPRLDVLLYGPAAVKQYAIFQELPSFRPETFATDLEERLGLALLELACQTADGSYLLGIAMDFIGLRLAAGPRRRLARRRGHGRGAAGTRAPPGSRGPGPASCRSPPTACRSSTGAPGFDDLIIASGHVFGNAAGPTTGRLVADLICGTEPAIDMTPFRADRPSLTPVAAGSDLVREAPVERRIAFINPFGTAAFDAIIEETLVPYAANGTVVDVIHLEGVPANIDYYYPMHLMQLAIFDEVRRLEEAGYDAVVVGCCYDPGVRVARELVDIPVVGPLEAAMNHASYFGHSFTVVTDHAKARPWLEDLVRIHGAGTAAASAPSTGT